MQAVTLSTSYPASVIKTYLDEQIAAAKVSGNNSFSNTIAQIAGNPANVQALGEALKSVIDTVSNTVSNNQTNASSQYNKIANLIALAGSATGNNGDLTHPILPDNATNTVVFEALAAAVALVRSDANTTAGGNIGALLNAIGDIVTQDSSYVQAFTAIVNRLESVEGEMTNFKGVVEFYHNGDEFPLTVDQLAGTEAFNTVETGLGTGESTDVAAYVTGLPIPRDVRILVSYGTDGDAGCGYLCS